MKELHGFLVTAISADQLFYLDYTTSIILPNHKKWIQQTFLLDIKQTLQMTKVDITKFVLLRAG